MQTAISQPPEQLLRLPQVLARIPVAASTWWQMVKDGRAPRPIKLGPMTTCWKSSDIDAFVAAAGGVQ